jgi:putative ATP-dependent endonuclease of OLD family
LHIHKVEIANFRNFGEFVAESLPATVLVVGENAVGKSNLIAALRLVLDPSLPDSARLLRREDFWEGLTAPFAGVVIKVVVELTGFDGDKAAQAILDSSVVKHSPMVARLTFLFRPKIGLAGAGPEEYEFICFGGDRETTRVVSDVRRYIAIRLLPALRDAESDLQSWSRSPLRPLLERLAIPDADVAEVAQGIEEATGKIAKNPQVLALNDDVGKRLKRMVGELFAVQTKLGVAATQPEHLLRSIRLLTAGLHDRAVSDSSLGTSNVIFLALLLENLERQRAANEVVVTVLAVEEPEAHLHPPLQRLVFRDLLRMGQPLLLTSHSPHIASVTPLDSLLLMRRSGKAGSKGFTARGAGLTKEEADDLQRYLDVTRAEMLFAKAVLFVEGAAELFVVPAMAGVLGYDLDALGVSLCSVHGTDFAPYRKLLGPWALAVPHVIITDGDPDAAGTEAGVLRGVRLPRSDPLLQAQLETDARLRDWTSARAKLRVDDVFVGQRTLEIDLLPTTRDKFKAAYDELCDGGLLAKANFHDAVDLAVAGNPLGVQGVLSRIDGVGKGRFAQRLAPRLVNANVPEYIRAAILRVAELAKAQG